jgi:hypothetical protein
LLVRIERRDNAGDIATGHPRRSRLPSTGFDSGGEQEVLDRRTAETSSMYPTLAPGRAIWFIDPTAGS